MAHTTDLGEPGPDNAYGAGLLQVDRPPEGWDGRQDTGYTGDTGDTGYTGDTGSTEDTGYTGGRGCGCSGTGGLTHLSVVLASLLLALSRRRAEH